MVERRSGNFRVLFAGELQCNGSGIVEEEEAMASWTGWSSPSGGWSMVLLIYVGDRSRLIHLGFGGVETMVLVERRFGGRDDSEGGIGPSRYCSSGSFGIPDAEDSDGLSGMAWPV